MANFKTISIHQPIKVNIHIFVWYCIKGKDLLEFYGPQMLAVKSPKKITPQIPVDHEKLICFRFIEYRRTNSSIIKVSQSWKLEEVHRIVLIFFFLFSLFLFWFPMNVRCMTSEGVAAFLAMPCDLGWRALSTKPLCQWGEGVHRILRMKMTYFSAIFNEGTG